MPKTKEEVRPIDGVFRRVIDELKADGKTNLKFEDTYDSSELAKSVVKLAASSQGLEVEIKMNKQSVTGKVVTPDES